MNNDIHDQSIRTREDCIVVFVDMNNVTAWCGARVRLKRLALLASSGGREAFGNEATAFSQLFTPSSSSRKHRINISDQYQTNNMCGSDIFLGFLAILFPPIAGE